MLRAPTAKDSAHGEARVDGSAEAAVDGRGLWISTAILYEVVHTMRELSPGEIVSVWTDPLPALDSDVRAWCRTTGHELVEVEQIEGAS